MEKESTPSSQLLSTVFGWLDSTGLLKIGVGSAGAVAAMSFLALGWAVYHRGDVKMHQFEGGDGAVMSLRLSRALEDVALGATSGLDVDPARFQIGDSAPPAVVIPGTGLSFSTMVSFMQIGGLAPTDIHGTYTAQAGNAQFFLQVIGPSGVRSIVTAPKQNLDDAVDEAAVSLYGVLRPAALAAYLYRRDAQRSLDLVRETLADPDCTPKDRAAAYRIWGLILRDQFDYDGARAKFEESLRASSWWDRGSSRSQALTLVDIGHTYQWERRWHAAATYYKRASDLQPTWAAPLNYLGDASQGTGESAAAIDFYEKAIAADPLYVEPWNGLGDAYASLGRFDDALEAYSQARSRHLKRDHSVAVTYYGMGDVLMQSGCPDAAAAPYEVAASLEVGRPAPRPVKQPSCQDSLPAIGYPWHMGASAETREKPCVLAASFEPADASASMALARRDP